MTARQRWIFAAIIALLIGAFALQRCTRDTSALERTEDGGSERSASPAAISATDASADAAARSGQAAIAAHDAAMAAAVTELHAYLAVLFKPDRSEADAYWVNRSPDASGEADLRTLDRVTSLRSENGRPETMTGATPPDSLEIPIRLRIGVDGAVRDYTGHYRLRRVVDGNVWRITSASITASPPRR